MSETLLEQMVARLLAYRDLPLESRVFDAATTAVIDTVGVTLLGSISEPARIARRTLSATDGTNNATTATTGSCQVYGTRLRCNVLDAAWLNGIASHADDFDDFTDLFGGHPSVPILPALLAVAEQNANTGESLLAAYVAGVEFENRLAMGVHFHHYDKGWHPTSTLGVFGAAAATAHLLRLDAAATVNALAIAASHASGIKANFGSMTKPLHVGHCARSGVQAVLLAANGYDAKPDVLEATQGFLNVYNGDGNYDTERMLGDWFDPPIALDPGANIKEFPCCGSTHPAAYMALDIARRDAFDHEAIEQVEIRVPTRRLPHTDNPQPTNGLQAKFSVQYAVVRCLLTGPLRLSDFDQSAYTDPSALALLKRTAVSADDSLGSDVAANPFAATVRVTLRGGRELVATTDHLPGRGREFPMNADELRAKFCDCAATVLPPEHAARMFDKLVKIRDCVNVREIAALAAP